MATGSVLLLVFKKSNILLIRVKQKCSFIFSKYFTLIAGVPGEGGGNSLYDLYGDLPLDRVWFLTSMS